RGKSFNGEELPYVFGVPLDGPKFHFVDSYTEHGRLFSEIVMTYFCNFAYTGNPNMPRKTEFLIKPGFMDSIRCRVARIRSTRAKLSSAANKKNNLSVEETIEIPEERKETKEREPFLMNGCNIVRMMSKSSKTDDYPTSKANNSIPNYNLTRQMSNSTIDAHTKVRDWITQEIVYKYSPRFFRRPRHNQTKTKIPHTADISGSTEMCNDSTLGRSPTRPVSPSDEQTIPQPLMKTSTITRPKIGNLRKCQLQLMQHLRKRKLRTFDPNADVNVTSRDDNDHTPTPLTPEESLMTIKRRNFPKVLPDHPGREALMHKRRSMPAHSLFLPIPESSSFSQPNSPTNKSFTKLPPTPPPRTTTLPKQSSTPIPVCASDPMLAELPIEEEVVCNNLYVGPLIPKSKSNSRNEGLNSQPIYDSLRNITKSDNEAKCSKPRTIITANPNMPIKRAEPKVVVRPTPAKRTAETKQNKQIPRLVVPDNQPQSNPTPSTHTEETISKETIPEADLKVCETTESVDQKRTHKKSQIPTLVKPPSPNKESSGSESTTPSEESDTGTVVKKV
ncbi:hypothetical protein NQ315_017122, partial [Exocentrus adspersus]